MRDAALSRRLGTALLSLALILGLAAIGLGHRFAPGAATGPIAEAAALAGLPAADLCGEPGGKPARDDGCPACRLAVAADLPAPPGLARPADRVLSAAWLPAPGPDRPGLRFPAAPPRAPPVARAPVA